MSAATAESHAEFPSLDSRQAATLRFIIEFIQGNKVPPSVREISKSQGLKSSRVPAVAALVKLGYLERLQVKTRNLAITKLAEDWYRANRAPQQEIPL